MRWRRVGRSSVRITELGFGAAPLGNLFTPVTDAQAYAAVDAAWEAGIRYFDTAPHYGLGLSERRLGAALAGRPRDEFVISTKVGRLLVPNPAPTGDDLAEDFAVPDDLTRIRDYSAAGVRRSLESSLERLGLDRIDVVLVHDPDDHLDQAVAEAIPALVELRAAGVVGAVGVGMNSGTPLRRLLVETDVDVVMMAGRFTPLDHSGEAVLDVAEDLGRSVLVAAPYNSGMLARDWPPDDATFDYGPAADRLAQARDLAGRLAPTGVTLPTAAIRFGLRRSGTSAVVVGLRSREEVAAAVQRYARPVPPETWDVVDAPVASRPGSGNPDA